MSRTFSTSRSSSSSDDSDRDYRGLENFSSQTSDGSIPALAISSNSFASQASEASIASTVTSPEQRPRPLDVSNILNPTPQRSVQHSRAASLAHFGSPRTSTPRIHHVDQRSLPPSPIDLSHASDAPRGGGGSTYPRRIAPAGPPSSTHARHSTRHSLSGIMSAQENPFPLGTPRRPGYGSDVHPAGAPPPPHLPAPPSGHQSPAFPFPGVSTSMQYAPSSFSTPMSSASASPNTSYSSYVQNAQSPLPPSTPTFNHPGYSLGHPSTPINNPYPLSLSTHGPHGGYPMMSLNTAHGAIQIPIDTTAASKSADEKRKRNAGASARFRQRRKEREREMSTRISDLEQRVKKVEEERDYYRDLALRLQRGGRSQQGPPQSLSPRGIGMAMGPGDSGFGGFRASEISRPGSSMRDFGSAMTGIESSNHGQGSGMAGGSSHSTPRMGMRQSMESGSGSALKRETEMYEREHHGAGGSDQRHH